MRRPVIVAGAIGLAMMAGAALAGVFRYLRRLFWGTPEAAETLPAGQRSRRRRSRSDSETDATSTTARAMPSPLATSPGLSGLALIGIPAATLAGGVFFIVVGLPWLRERQHFPMPPEQPIYFSHEVHVQQAGLDCAFCHRTADLATTAGLPDVQQCMFCHVVVEDLREAPQRAAYQGQIAKLREAALNAEGIEWTRVHRVPDHTRFPHDAHVQAGVPCATCHGDVENMDLAQQVRSFRMDDCVACHQETSAPNECVDCHH